ncbi:MAG: thymidylate synthase [Candidatus Spechtbacterales bacterium]
MLQKETIHREYQYLDLLVKILREGDDRQTRNGMTRALFAEKMEFDVSFEHFPLLTTKKVYFKGIAGELLWFIEGSGDNNRLKEILGTDETFWSGNEQADYWTPKAQFPGDLGRIYGVQWRSWRGANGKIVDQLAECIEGIKNNPHERRHIVSAWNPPELDEMPLPPCHMFFQIFVREDRLDLLMHQRSCDMFLGVPFNIASYALLLCLVARVTGYKPGKFTHSLGDTHIYHDHFSAVFEQINRKPMPFPSLSVNATRAGIDDFSLSDITLTGYNHHPPIKADLNV